jgi:quinol monooxygenase YgiN
MNTSINTTHTTVIISGHVQIRRESRNEAIALARWMASETTAEPGCLSYRFSVSLEDDCQILIFEAWASDEALKAHFKTPHMQVFNSKLPNFLASKPEIYRYQVSSTAPF